MDAKNMRETFDNTPTPRELKSEFFNNKIVSEVKIYSLWSEVLIFHHPYAMFDPISSEWSSTGPPQTISNSCA